jgi:hypothetical protein
MQILSEGTAFLAPSLVDRDLISHRLNDSATIVDKKDHEIVTMAISDA